MSDEQNGVGRREALWLLLGAPLHVGLLASPASAQLSAPRNVRILDTVPVPGAATPAPGSPIVTGAHPRTFVTPAIVTSLRAQLRSDAAFRARWQTAVSQFESKDGTWTRQPKDSYATAFAAFLTCVRRPDDDLGLTWSASWRDYRTKILTSANTWHKDGKRYSPHAIAWAMVYDFLYNDLTPTERGDIAAIVQLGADRGGWVTGVHAWDNNESDNHIQKLMSSLVLDDAMARFPEAYRNTLEWADSIEWFSYAQGIGYEWKNSAPSRVGLSASLFALKNAAGLSDAQTIDRVLVHLRDAWQFIRHFIIPHPASQRSHNDAALYWLNDRVNMTAPAGTVYHRGLNVGASMMWALAYLPGKVELDGASGYSDQATLAKSEEAYFGYLRHVLDTPTPGQPDRRLRNVIDFSKITMTSPTPVSAGVYGLFTFPAWLVLNVKEYAPLDPVAAGIPKVRRWWPGTLDWTTIKSDFGDTTSTLISYHHRKYWMSGYEEGTRQNGSWHVHRAGPLMGQRGSASHGSISRKATWGANGTISFVDHSLYPEFTMMNQDEHEAGNVRHAGGSRKSKAAILEDSARTDYGDVTSWYADSRVVAISSNLTRSYNSTLVQTGSPIKYHEPKISGFTREFVCVQRHGDGTDHEHVFTYDRIMLLNTKFEPRYNLCPATEPQIDGVETAHEPWAPSDGSWTAVGPTRWDYANATRLIYDNRKEPKAPIAGNGKVCVTWLQPSGAGVKVQKLGGTNVRSEKEKAANGAPGINPWNGWVGLDGEWNKFDELDQRAYSGLYTVSVSPSPVTLDTRFLMVCDVMAATDEPGAAAALACDAGSVAARCGASAAVFSKEAAGHRSGSVTIPPGVTLVVLANVPAGQVRQLSASGGLAITTPERTASAGNTVEGRTNLHGRLVIGVSGSGTLTFS